MKDVVFGDVYICGGAYGGGGHDDVTLMYAPQKRVAVH